MRLAKQRSFPFIFPDAANRYVLNVDTGDAQPRVVLSGLRGVLEPSQLTGRRCVVVCNLPTRDMKGVVSTGLMLVATSAEGSKIPLTPPESSPNGTRVTLPNFPGDVAAAGTNLKKLWERIGDKFSTNDSCAALLEGGGVLTTPQGECCCYRHNFFTAFDKSPAHILAACRR